MTIYLKKLISQTVIFIVIIAIALANWQWPLYSWLGDTTVYRFVWLAIFFVLLDVVIEVILSSVKELRLMGGAMGFSRDIHKLSGAFHLLTKVSLPNNLKADFVAVGSSGVWLVDVKDGDGVIIFNGDDLAQNGVVLKGLLPKVLEKSYALAEFLKTKLNRDLRVAPVIAFSSPQANTDSVPKNVRGVYISSRKNITSVIENTDFQVIDKNTIEEVYKALKK